MAEEAEQSGPEVKALVKDGIWQVPPEDRPKDWETKYTGVTEPPDAPWATALVKAETLATVTTQPDMENITVSATSPGQIPHLQQSLLDWCREKLKRQRSELAELTAAYKQAKDNKWNTSRLGKARSNAADRVMFFRKIIDAMEAGFCLLPTMPCNLFAVRVSEDAAVKRHVYYWGKDVRIEADAEVMESGGGKYVGSTIRTSRDVRYVTAKDFQGKEQVVKKDITQPRDFRDVTFPFELAKPEMMERVSEAMKLRIFDELGFVPPQPAAAASGDPIIVGRVIDPTNQRRLSFLIGWLVDTRQI